MIYLATFLVAGLAALAFLTRPEVLVVLFALALLRNSLRRST